VKNRIVFYTIMIAGIILSINPILSECIVFRAHGAGTAPDQHRPTDNTEKRMVKDDLSRDVFIPVDPLRIIALSSADVEIMFAVDAEEKLVGRPDSVRYPSAALGVDRIGATGSIFNTESILEKEPDLVLLSMSKGHQWGRNLERLESCDVTTFCYHYPISFLDTLQYIKRIGDVVGKRAAADVLCRDIEERAAAIIRVTQTLRTSQKPRVYLEPIDEFGGAWRTNTRGSQSRENALIEMAGGSNIFNDVENTTFIANSEEIIERNPEVIILTANTSRRSAAYFRQLVMKRTGWDYIDAVRNDRIYVVEQQLTYANPRIIQGLESIACYLHPELFQSISKKKETRHEF
jgi:iron complex transport system substrate-binding protein